MIIHLTFRDQAIQLGTELQLTKKEKIQAFRFAQIPVDISKRTEAHYQKLLEHLQSIPSFEERVFAQLAEYPQCKWVALGVAAYLDRHEDVGLVTPEREEELRVALESLVSQGQIRVIRRADYTCYCIEDVPTHVTGAF